MRLQNDAEFLNDFLDRLGAGDKRVQSISVGGLHEKDVPSVLNGAKTKAKTDLTVQFDDGTFTNVSIKKSVGGQVYLITCNHFIAGFEKQFAKVIPEEVKRAIMLFWGAAEDVSDIVNSVGTNRNYELRKHRLVGETLNKYNAGLYSALLDWIKENMYEIVMFCFATGLTEQRSDWADAIWYINELGDESFNFVCKIDVLASKARDSANETVCYGNRGHGTTIRLPFGFVQWHSPTKAIPGCLQFHHNLYAIKSTLQAEQI